MNISKISPVAFRGTLTTNTPNWEEMFAGKPTMLEPMKTLATFVESKLPDSDFVTIDFYQSTEGDEKAPIDANTGKRDITVSVNAYINDKSLEFECPADSLGTVRGRLSKLQPKD